MSKVLEILGIAPIVETEEVKAVKNAKATGAEKVAEKIAEDDAKMANTVEQLEEEERKSFVGGLKSRGAELREKRAKEADRADFDAAVAEMANIDDTDDDEDDSIIESTEDSTEDSIDEPTETVSAEDSGDDSEDIRIAIRDDIEEAAKMATIKPDEEPDLVSEDKIEEIKQSIESRADSVIDILKNSRPVISEEETQMEERNFYDEIGDMAYEYDRTGVMDVRLEDYIKRTAAKDKDLCFQFINSYFLEYIENNGDLIPVFFDNYIEDMLRKNPDWIPKLDEKIVNAANDSMNIKVGFVRRIQPNDVVYSTLAEAIEDMPYDLHNLAMELTLTEESFFEKIWQEVSPDGEEIRRLTRDEVKQYVSDFRGDKDILIRILQLNDGEDDNAKNPSDSKESER